MNRYHGLTAGYEAGELFLTYRTVGVDDLMRWASPRHARPHQEPPGMTLTIEQDCSDFCRVRPYDDVQNRSHSSADSEPSSSTPEERLADSLKERFPSAGKVLPCPGRNGSETSGVRRAPSA